MPVKPEEVQVIISYKQLTELLSAAQGLTELNSVQMNQPLNYAAVFPQQNKILTLNFLTIKWL